MRISSGLPPQAPAGDTLLPASMTETLEVRRPAEPEGEKELDASAVFAKLTSLKRTRTDDEDED